MRKRLFLKERIYFLYNKFAIWRYLIFSPINFEILINSISVRREKRKIISFKRIFCDETSYSSFFIKFHIIFDIYNIHLSTLKKLTCNKLSGQHCYRKWRKSNGAAFFSNLILMSHVVLSACCTRDFQREIH